MIKINNLSKVYKSRNNKKQKNIVLKNLTFTLPDTGFIFIIGKSGSGKSTLLNMIGGLDDYTSGEIIVDGNNFSTFTSKDFMKYRSSYLGFVFQHYNLLDELTVRQNIELSMDISGITDKSIVEDVLAEVEMSGYEERYPYELSGGQRQRIAIARALAKDPKLILGDEPTGNLDNKTTKLVMEVLKKISKIKLVVIVSHDIESAYIYADRIIELNSGNIISDIVKKDNYNNEFTITDNDIVLPYHKDLTEEETADLLNEIKKDEIKNIVQLDSGFIDNNDDIVSDKVTELSSNNLSLKNTFKLAKVFLRKRFISSLSIILVTTLIFVVISITQSMIRFDPNNYNFASNETVVLKKYDQVPFKESVHTSNIHDITDDEYQKISSSKTDGNIFKLYNYTIGTSQDKISAGVIRDINRNYEEFYCKESLGTLNCSLDYLKKIYGIDGNLNILAGEIRDDDCKMILTDYVADSLIYSIKAFNSYEDIINSFSLSNISLHYSVSAVIETGYKNKYASIIEEYANSIDYSNTYSNIVETSLYKEFLEDVNTHLGICYNINPNFEEDIKTIRVNSTFRFCCDSFSGNGKEYKIDKNISIPVAINTFSDITVNEGEVAISYSVYNQLFSTSYNESTYNNFTPHDFTITNYIDGDNTKGVIYSKTYHLTKLTNGNSIVLNDKDYITFFSLNLQNYGLYFDNVSNVESIAHMANDLNIHPNSIDQDNILFINKFVNSFVPFLKLIFVILIIFELAYLILFGINNIRQNLYEIGVLKSLGGKTKDIGVLFILNVLLSGIGICISSVIFSPIIIKIINRMLTNSFSRVLDIVIFDLRIVRTLPSLMAFNMFAVIFISFISSIISIIFLYKVKPIEIIKAKE